jgi:hypothetical protein
VDNWQAIHLGGLANNSLFFGDNTAETMSDINGNGSWNREHTYTTTSDYPFAGLGGESGLQFGGGVFSFSRMFGSANGTVSHRTILSGY